MGPRLRGHSLCLRNSSRPPLRVPRERPHSPPPFTCNPDEFLMIKLCNRNLAAPDKLPPKFQDKSGIGAHYVDAFVAPMNATLPDTTRVSCKRRGLRVTLKVGLKKGDGIMRRLQVSKDP